MNGVSYWIVIQDDTEEEEDKLQIMKKRSAIVFCNTCKIVQLLSELLRVFHVWVCE